MEKLMKLFNEKSGMMLFIFPHFDDCAFVSSGLLQVATRNNINTNVVVLYEKENKFDEEDLLKYSKYLAITKTEKYKVDHKSLKHVIEKLIEEKKPSTIISFDPAGITGNSHHTLVSLNIYEVLQNMKNPPQLLWRVADTEEEKYFGKMPYPLGKKYENIIHFNLGLRESIKKIKAIFTNRSKFKGLNFKLRILEWYLFDHKESYYLIDFKKDKLNIIYT
jgi:LmbE family N-acetylglucosaminyl deacetylase